MLGSLILYLKGMRRMMFQLSGFYCRVTTQLPTRTVTRTSRVNDETLEGLRTCLEHRACAGLHFNNCQECST